MTISEIYINDIPALYYIVCTAVPDFYLDISWYIRVSQGAKSLKNYTFSPESHYSGKSWLKIYKNFKIFAYLGVAQILLSLFTSVCSEQTEKMVFA